MALNPQNLPESARQVVSGANETRQALGEMKGKMEVFSDVGQQLKEFAKDFKSLDNKERMKRIGSIVALGILGYAFGNFNKDEREWMERGVHGDEETPDEEVSDELIDEVYNDDYEPEAEDFDVQRETGEIPMKQTYVNMYAMRYYKEDGTLFAKPSNIFQGEEACRPSKFILKGSAALFERGRTGLGSFDEFTDHVSEKLVHEEVEGRDERIRQAAMILSHCAVGRYQILPIYHFKKMGWPTTGIEGLRAMYDFIRENDRQIDTHMAIIGPLWNRYRDPALVGIAYYSGDSKVERFRQNPDAEEFTRTQFGGHGSIKAYAEKCRGLFARAKQKVKENAGREASDLEALEITLERIESGGSSAYERILAGREPNIGAPEGTRMLSQSDVTPEIEAAAREAQQELAGMGVGAQKRVEIGGKTYVFQREIHTNRNPNGAEGTTAYEVI